MINLELYRIFYVVAQEQNITKASKILNISQPAVTKHLQNLEDQIGTPLFIRTKKGVILNEYGRKIFLQVKEALDLIDEVEYSINESINTYSGIIRLGISTSLAKFYLENHLESFHTLFPNVLFDIYTDPTQDLLDKLKSGSIDLIISKIPDKQDQDLDYQVVDKTKNVFCFNPKYFSFNSIINPSDLENIPILLQKEPSSNRKSADKYFQEHNINITPIMNIASSNLLISLVKSGFGIGFVTQLYIQDELKKKELKVLKIQSEPASINFGIITVKNGKTTKIINLFIKHIKS